MGGFIIGGVKVDFRNLNKPLKKSPGPNGILVTEKPGYFTEETEVTRDLCGD